MSETNHDVYVVNGMLRGLFDISRDGRAEEHDRVQPANEARNQPNGNHVAFAARDPAAASPGVSDLCLAASLHG